MPRQQTMRTMPRLLAASWSRETTNFWSSGNGARRKRRRVFLARQSSQRHPSRYLDIMAATGEPTNKPFPCSFMERIGCPALKDSKMPCPVTMVSATSYSLLAANMFNPDLLHRVSNRDLTNVLLGTTVVGGSMYLAGRSHLAGVTDKKQKILFSVYGSTMVTLGSLLLWAMGRALMPDNAVLRTTVAVGSSIVLLKTGKAYLDVIDAANKKSSN